MITPSDHSTWSDAIAGRRKVVTANDGATLAQAGTQVAAGAGQDVPPQSSQWLQGSPSALRSVTGALDGTAAAATVIKPPARTARQPKTAVRTRTRCIGQ